MGEYIIAPIGSRKVGKTNLMIQFASNFFAQGYSSDEAQTYRKELYAEDENVKVVFTLLDCPYLPFNAKMMQKTVEYIKSAHGFMICFAVDNRDSFAEVSKYVDLIARVRESKSSFPFIVVGCKSDVEARTVSQTEAEALATSLGTVYVETSAKMRKGVAEAFYEIAQRVEELKSQTKPKCVIQ